MSYARAFAAGVAWFDSPWSRLKIRVDLDHGLNKDAVKAARKHHTGKLVLKARDDCAPSFRVAGG